MQFIREVLIISENRDLAKELKQDLESNSQKIKITTVDSKSSVSQVLAETKISSVFVNLLAINDSLYVLKQLSLYKMKSNPKLSIFLTSENFETFHGVVSEINQEMINIIPWPVSAEEVTQSIINEIFENKISTQVIKKGKNSFNVDLEFIQVFIEATKTVINEMGQVERIQHQKPLLKNKMENPLENGIASKIMISSDFFKGNFYVVFPEPSFLKLYEKAVMETHSEINDENRDFAGELANIIYGQSKKVLAASGLNLDMAIPSIHPSSNIASELVIVIPFDSSIGKFYIAVAPGEL